MNSKELIILKAIMIEAIQNIKLKDINRNSPDDILLMDSDEYHLSLRIK